MGLIVGVIGLVLYLKSRIGARPMCLMKTLRLLGKIEQQLPPEVQILYQGGSVPRLSLTHVYIWNGGRETILGSQIVQDDTLRCVFPQTNLGDHRILKANVASVTRLVNKFTVQIHPEKKNEAILSFDFLDPGDGARIDLLHTSGKQYPEVLGTFRGLPSGVVLLTGPSRSHLRRAIALAAEKRTIFYSVPLVLGIITLILGILPSELLQQLSNIVHRASPAPELNGVSAMRSAFLIVGGLYTLLPLYGLLATRKKYPSALDEDSSLAGHQL